MLFILYYSTFDILFNIIISNMVIKLYYSQNRKLSHKKIKSNILGDCMNLNNDILLVLLLSILSTTPDEDGDIDIATNTNFLLLLLLVLQNNRALQNVSGGCGCNSCNSGCNSCSNCNSCNRCNGLVL